MSGGVTTTMGFLRSIESGIERVVEGTFGRVFRSPVQPVELARKLVKELEAGKVESIDGTYAPNEFTVFLNPEDRQTFAEYEVSLRTELGVYLADHARREGLTMLSRPRVVFESEPRLSAGTFGISTAVSEPGESVPASAQVPPEIAREIAESDPAAAPVAPEPSAEAERARRDPAGRGGAGAPARGVRRPRGGRRRCRAGGGATRAGAGRARRPAGRRAAPRRCPTSPSSPPARRSWPPPGALPADALPPLPATVPVEAVLPQPEAPRGRAGARAGADRARSGDAGAGDRARAGREHRGRASRRGRGRGPRPSTTAPRCCSTAAACRSTARRS